MNGRRLGGACENWKRKTQKRFCTRLHSKRSATWISWRRKMPIGKPGEVWQTDLGMQAKVRPCLVLTQPPQNDELAMVTLVAHTTSVRGSRWEVAIPRHFLQAGAFDVQRVVTVDAVKLERKPGEFSLQEFNAVLDKLAERLGI